MLALVPKLRMYPVLLPVPPARDRVARAAARRRRLAPATRMLLIAACLVLPAIAYVHQTAVAARTGYAILGLRQDIRTLQIENGRLVATVMELRAPERIERIAVHDLGMFPPRGQQFASLKITPAVAAVRPTGPTWQQRLSGLFLGREAAAGESR
ncbi:MAG TPA: cell division protein FtsL [bacterium]|nr:cell division protein FtsL [bacterium]